MRSKTSCFNKTLFLKNCTRFAPLWVLYLILLFCMLPLTLFQQTRNTYELLTAQDRFTALVGIVNVNIAANLIIVFLMAIVCSLFIFGYLFHSRNTNMMHAFPVRREELFITGYVNICLFLIIPQIICFLLSLIVCICNDVTRVEYLLFWLLCGIAATILFVSAAVFCCMLTGNGLAAFAYYVIGNFLYVGIKALLILVTSEICYGMDSWGASIPTDLIHSGDGFLSPLPYLLAHVRIEMLYDANWGMPNTHAVGVSTIALYLIPAVILFAAALVLYKKRQLECAGDIVSFRPLYPLFRWGIGFCGGLSLAMILAAAFFYDTDFFIAALIILAAVLTLVLFLIAEMILKKRARIFTKPRLAEGLICTALMLFVLCGLKADLFGLERKVPDTRQVEYATLDQFEFRDAEDIAALIDIHEDLIRHKKEYQSMLSSYEDSIETDYSTITYYYKNGKTMTRSYSFPILRSDFDDPNSLYSKIAALEDDPESYLTSSICENYEALLFMGGNFENGYYSKENGEYIYDSSPLLPDQAKILFDAYVKDVKEGNYPYGIRSLTRDENTDYVQVINIWGYLPGSKDILMQTDEFGNEMTHSNINEVNLYIDLDSGCRHTIQALIDLGFIADESELSIQPAY